MTRPPEKHTFPARKFPQEGQAYMAPPKEGSPQNTGSFLFETGSLPSGDT